MRALAPLGPVAVVQHLPKRLPRPIAHAGQQFGRLTAIAPYGTSPTGVERWLLRCDCGSPVVRTAHTLRRPDAACGSLPQEHDGHSFAGRTFGYLTALDPLPPDPATRVPHWRFRCRCGTIIEASLGDISGCRGRKSCGCGKKQPRAPWLNQIIGRLTLLAPNLHVTGPEQWWCLCRCGRYVSRLLKHLQSGNTQSCGCLHASEVKERDPLESRDAPFRLGRPGRDHAGKVFHRLTAVAPDYSKPVGKRIHWWFDCSCGTRVSRPINAVVGGTTRSCGCYRRELSTARLAKLRRRGAGKAAPVPPRSSRPTVRRAATP